MIRISKNIYFVKSDIKEHRHNMIVMKLKDLKQRFKAWQKQRMENGMRIANDLIASNQDLQERLLNIGKRK